MAEKWIKRSEYEHLAPAQVGKLRTNHNSDECRGDSASLLIERSQYGISCYCFRCGGRGYFGLDRRYVPPAERFGRTDGSRVLHVSGAVLPADVAPVAESGEKAPQAWLNKAGVLPEAVAKEGFLWSEAEQALYIPVHQYRSVFGPVIAGYVKRSFAPKDYRTVRIRSGGLWGLYRGEGGREVQAPSSDGALVLVEDVLSALRVAQAGWDAMALCGTELHPEAMNFALTEGYQRAIIFLDGDNPTVKMKTRKITNRLSGAGLPTSIIETGQDPKHYPDDQLRKMLEGA